MTRRHVALDFGGTTIKAGLAVEGAWSEVITLPAPADLPGLAGVERSLSSWGAEGLDGIGIAVPGVVAPGARGLGAAHGKYQAMLGADLVGWAADCSGVPAERVVLENDARAALAGELAGGAAAGARHAALLVLGTGVGTALFTDGILLRGRAGHAGNLGGHVTVDLDGPRCPCGNRGCVETRASSWALPGLLAAADPDRASSLHNVPGLGFRDLFRAADDGDQVAARLVESVLDAWAAASATLCLYGDPEVLVLCGGPLQAGDRIRSGIESRLDDLLWRGMPRPLVRVAQDPAHSVLRGLLALSISTGGRP